MQYREMGRFRHRCLNEYFPDIFSSSINHLYGFFGYKHLAIHGILAYGFLKKIIIIIKMIKIERALHNLFLNYLFNSKYSSLLTDGKLVRYH